MIRIVISYYDKDLKQFKGPSITNATDLDDLTRDVKAGIVKGYDAKLVNQMIHQEIYYLGTYDDQLGVLQGILPEKILDCDDLIIERKKIEEESKKLEVGA